jgi:hypothetical protein
MNSILNNEGLNHLVVTLSSLWKDEQDHILLARAIHGLDTRYDLNRKIASEPGVEEIIKQMFGRLASSFEKLSDIWGKKILDIACGSSTSKAPSFLYIDTPFGEKKIGRAKQGHTAQFEPWFCRIVYELGANIIGIDFGNLEREVFKNYQIDLGKIGALDFFARPFI